MLTENINRDPNTSRLNEGLEAILVNFHGIISFLMSRDVFKGAAVTDLEGMINDYNPLSIHQIRDAVTTQQLSPTYNACVAPLATIADSLKGILEQQPFLAALPPVAEGIQSIAADYARQVAPELDKLGLQFPQFGNLVAKLEEVPQKELHKTERRRPLAKDFFAIRKSIEECLRALKLLEPHAPNKEKYQSQIDAIEAKLEKRDSKNDMEAVGIVGEIHKWTEGIRHRITPPDDNNGLYEIWKNIDSSFVKLKQAIKVHPNCESNEPVAVNSR